MAVTKTDEKKVETKQPEYPDWPGNELAEDDVVYRLPKSGNLIQKGAKADG